MNSRYRNLVQSGLCITLGLFMAGCCEARQPARPGAAVKVPDKLMGPQIWMTVGERRFAITLADNAATRALAASLPLTLNMADLNGNEKYASLPRTLPENVYWPETIHNGDLMLYGADTLVIFYLTFNSPYSWAPRITDDFGAVSGAQARHLPGKS